MIHESDAQRVPVHARRRRGLLDVRNEAGRQFRPARQLPLDDIQKPTGLPTVWIVEAPPVKMFGKF
jgi:hypothetical protein